MLRQLLEILAKKRTARGLLVERSQIILHLLAGRLNLPTARKLNLRVDTVRTWRKRWLTAQVALAQLEPETRTQAATDQHLKLEKVLAAYLEKLLTDLPRSGTPATFTPEQIVLIVAVACEEASRQIFLSDPAHRLSFRYTPKHSSWLNQIEIWFSILVPKLLQRSNFKSVAALRERILAFIGYYNAVLANPFAWTYKGKPLQV